MCWREDFHKYAIIGDQMDILGGHPTNKHVLVHVKCNATWSKKLVMLVLKMRGPIIQIKLVQLVGVPTGLVNTVVIHCKVPK